MFLVRLFASIVTFVPALVLADAVSGDAPALAGTLGLQVENDRIANTDRHYSNGVRLFYVSEEGAIPEWIRNLGRQAPYLGGIAAARYGVTVGQSIFTPEDTARRTLIANDQPYAGWLYGGVALMWETRRGSRLDTLDTLELDLGVVGPAAVGEQVQNTFHHWIGVDESKGWDNQLANEPAVLLTYERKWRARRPNLMGPLDADLTPHLGASLGNVNTSLGIGATIRIGQSLADDYGPPRIRPSLPGSAFFHSSGFAWYLFAGVEGRAVAHSIFLDGNTFEDGPSVDRRPLVGDVQAGASLIFGTVRLSYTQVLRTEAFREQRGRDSFGAVSLSVNF